MDDRENVRESDPPEREQPPREEPMPSRPGKPSGGAIQGVQPMTEDEIPEAGR